MIFSLFIMPASAVDADYTIAENCSVTLVKEDNFKTDDTSVAVSVKLDDRLTDCYMIIYAYAGNTRFDPDGDFNVRLWTGKVTNCTEQIFTFMPEKLPLKVGNKIIASLNVPVGEDAYRPVNSQAIEVVDENGEGFKPYVYPDVTINETEPKEGETTLHISMTGDERIFEAARNGLTEINYSIGMYPDGEDFDFEGENQISLLTLGETTEPFSGKEVKLSEPLRAGYRVRAVAYWTQNPDIYLPKGNDYDKTYGKKDDSVLIKAKPQAPGAAVKAPVYADDESITVSVKGDVPENAMLLVKSYTDGDTEYEMTGGSFVANKFDVTAGDCELTVSEGALSEGDVIVAFLQSQGTVYAKSEAVTVSSRPAFAAQLEGVVTSESDTVTYSVSALADEENINIAKLCRINSDGTPDADNPVAAKYGQTAGKITFDGLSGKLSAGDKMCLVLVYANGAKTYVSDAADVIKPVGADSITIIEERFDITSTKATVVVKGCEEYIGTYSTLFLSVGSEKTIDDADSRHKIASKKFTGEGTYEFTFDNAELKAGQNIQANIYLYDSDADRTYYKYGNAVVIEEAGDTPVEPVEDSIKFVEEKFDTTSTKATVVVTGYDDFANKNARLFLTVGDASNTDDGDSRTKIAQVMFTTAGTYEFTFDSSKLTAGETLLAYLYMYDLDTDRTYYKYGTPVVIEEAGDTPEKEPTVSVEGEIKTDSEKISVKVEGKIPDGAMLLAKSYPADSAEFAMTGGTWVASGFDVKVGANELTVNSGTLKAGEKIVVFLQNGGTLYAQSEPVTVTGDSTPTEPEAPTAFINAPKGITAGMTKTKATITFDRNADNVSYRLYQFDGETLDEETAEVLSENSVYLPGGTTIPLGRGKMKPGFKLQLVVTADGVKAYSNVIEVGPSPDWGTPTATFNVSAVKTTDKTVSVTVNYADEYIAMGEDFFCDITVYQYDGKYTDSEFEDNELWENPNLVKRVGQLNKLYGDETRGVLTVTFKESAVLKAGDRLVIKLRLPHTEWEGVEVDYLSASIPVIGENETVPTEKVVLYNISADTSKGARLRAVLDRLGVAYEEITADRLNDTVGFIAGLDGYTEAEEPYTGKDYTSEFMLMCSLSETTLDNVLAALGENGISIGHKAIVTDTNKEWKFYELLDEIADEHEVMQNLVKLNDFYKEASVLDTKDYESGEVLTEFEKALSEAQSVLSESEPTAERIDAAYSRLEKAYSALTGKTAISGRAVITIEKTEDGKYTVAAEVKDGADTAEYEYIWNGKQGESTRTGIAAEELIGLKLTVKDKNAYGSLSAVLGVPVLSGVKTTVTKKSISVSWTADEGSENTPKAEVYNVTLYLGETEVETLTTAENKAVIDGLKANTEYTLTVTAQSPVGISDTYRAAVKTSKATGGGSSSSAAVTYTVKFDTNGGSTVKNVTVKRNETVGNIGETKKEGFVFDGWYYDGEFTKPYSADDRITESLTLYASWKVDPLRLIVLTIGKNEASVFGEEKVSDAAPKLANNRTMLPARFVAENLGASVEWDGEKRVVTVTGKNIKTGEEVVIVITIGAETATVNGESVKLDSPAFIENNRTYTPIRFISENLGADVEWDDEAKRVTITK